VLTSEEGVAKGIRRITAQTGDAALQAQALGWRLSQDIANLAQNQANLAATESSIKSLTSALNDSEISAVVKVTLREELAALSRNLIRAKKEQEKALVAKLVADVTAAWTTTLPPNSVYLVHHIPDFPVTNVKLAKAILTMLQKSHSNSNLCLVLSSSYHSGSSSNRSNKILLTSMSAKKGNTNGGATYNNNNNTAATASVATLDCKAWLNAALNGLRLYYNSNDSGSSRSSNNVSFEARGGGNKNAAQFTLEVVTPDDGAAATVKDVAQKLLEQVQSVAL